MNSRTARSKALKWIRHLTFVSMLSSLVLLGTPIAGGTLLDFQNGASRASARVLQQSLGRSERSVSARGVARPVFIPTATYPALAEESVVTTTADITASITNNVSKETPTPAEIPPTATPTQAPPSPTRALPTPTQVPPTATPLPPTPVPPVASAVLGPLEGQMLNAINTQREAAGLAPVTPSRPLIEVARVRSQDMAANSYFSHTTSDGSNVITILRTNGIQASAISEILGKTNGADGESVAMVMNSFMNSPSHRDSILNQSFARAGVGLGVGAGNMKYFVVVFTK